MKIKCNDECPKGLKGVCCFSCVKKETCDEVCDSDHGTCGYSSEVEDEESVDIVAFQADQLVIITAIADIITTKKQLEETEKKLKEQIKAAMEFYNVKKFDNDILRVTYIAATTATSIDSAALKKKYPAIAEECSKQSPKVAYVKIEVK